MNLRVACTSSDGQPTDRRARWARRGHGADRAVGGGRAECAPKGVQAAGGGDCSRIDKVNSGEGAGRVSRRRRRRLRPRVTVRGGCWRAARKGHAIPGRACRGLPTRPSRLTETKTTGGDERFPKDEGPPHPRRKVFVSGLCRPAAGCVAYTSLERRETKTRFALGTEDRCDPLAPPPAWVRPQLSGPPTPCSYTIRNSHPLWRPEL